MYILHVIGPPSKSSKSTAESRSSVLVIARHSFQQRPHPPLHRLDLTRRALDLKHAPYLVDVHLRLCLPLHRDDGSAASTDHDADVIAQFHLRVQYLPVPAVERVQPVVVEALPRAGSIACPKFRLPVVAAGGEHVTGRVPLHVPDRHVVGEWDLSGGFLRPLRS
jgi:hypothetical protein